MTAAAAQAATTRRTSWTSTRLTGDRTDGGDQHAGAAGPFRRAVGQEPWRTRLDHHGRPQEDRDHVPLHHFLLLPGGWGDGAAGAHPAGRAAEQVPHARAV